MARPRALGTGCRRTGVNISRPAAALLGLRQLHPVADDRDEPDRDEDLDDDPGGIELEAAHAELGARRVGVVVVVQALAAREPGEQPDIGRAIAEEVLPPPPVPEPVDGRRQHEHVQDEVSQRHREAPDRAEEQHGHAHADDAAHRAPVEEHAVPHVVLDVLGPARDRLGVAGLADVVVDVPELDLPEAVHQRAVRVAFLVGERVVLPVHRHPLAPILPRADPENAPEDPVGDRVQLEGAMRQSPMEVHRGGDDRRLRHQERREHGQQESKHVRISL